MDMKLFLKLPAFGQVVWSGMKISQEYHINNVIGPDEYKEHVNNNAFTNYMAYFNLKLAIRYYETLIKEHSQSTRQLDK